MAWDATAGAAASTVAVEAPKIIANWVAVAAGNASGGVPQKGVWYDSFEVGTDTDTDIDIRANNGDANNPFIRYDASENKWVYSNDGSTTADFGVVPQNAVILYVGTSCPTGYTDITSTYEDRYIMADSLATAAVSTGGSLNTSSHTHTVSKGPHTPAASLTTYYIELARSGTSYSHYNLDADITSGATVATIQPTYAGFRLCQKN